MAATEFPTEFVGRRGALFWLALKTSVLTVLTLGFYRFWMKTRLRRYYWSSVRPGGTPVEYVGEPIEKLLGFLIAVVFLAFYIGVVNLVLVFASFSLLQTNLWAYALSFVGVIPIIFYAQYRARRYVLARTRWRGIRFGLDDGAWGYAWRAALHWLATLLTAGLLWPRMTFWLEKYRTDRSWYGDARLTQGGRWTMLYPPFLPVILFAVASLGAIGAGTSGVPQAFLALGLTLPGLGIALVHYRVASFRRLAAEKTAGDIGLRAEPRTWRVVRIYSLGGLGVFLMLAALLTGFALAVGVILAGIGAQFGAEADPLALIQALPTPLTAAIAALLYFSFFVLWGVLTHVFLTLPLMRHYAETLTITGAGAVAQVAQRDRDHFAEAEGFAEALDVGAAI